MITEIDVMIIISCVGFIVLSSVIILLRATIKTQDALLSEALSQIREFVLASLAFKASADIHPMTGPAVIQQLGKMKKGAPPVSEEELKPDKSGVSITQGLNR